jgi:monofunctional biosynthetic peptidoglycan transglycosylase
VTERDHGAEWEAAEGCGEPRTQTGERATGEPARARAEEPEPPVSAVEAAWPRAAGGGAAGVAVDVRVAAEMAEAAPAKTDGAPLWSGPAVTPAPERAPPEPEASDKPEQEAPPSAEQTPHPQLPEQASGVGVVAVGDVLVAEPAPRAPDLNARSEAAVLPQPQAIEAGPAAEPSPAEVVNPLALTLPLATSAGGERPNSFTAAPQPPLMPPLQPQPDIWVPAPPRPAPRRYVRTALRAAALAVAGLCVLLLALVVLYRWVDPPMSSLMLGQRLTGTPITQRWVPLADISPNLQLAAIVSEDARFCRHAGVDWGELMEAIESVGDGIARGGSTISMQVVKNLFLWPSKSYLRKAIEIPLAYLIEAAWSKPRILEIYLNIAEWGPGVFGAEAAARYHFRKRAWQLTPREAALLAVSLPNPFERQAGTPGPGTLRLADTLLARMRVGQAHAACVRDRGGGG